MDYLALTKEALSEASVREDVASVTTLVGATGITADFARWVKRAWENIQIASHGRNWWFRQALDQTMALAASDDDYTLAAGLETLNWRTVSVYTTAKTDESQVTFIPYEQWRMQFDTRSATEGVPTYITQRPDDVIQVYPVPDQAYTLRFDGVRSLQTLSADADEPYLPERYQMAIVWQAVMRFAKNHEDSSKYADANDEYRQLYNEIVEQQTPPVQVLGGHLYGSRRSLRRD